MSSTFPRARRRGYDVTEVEDFLEDARRAYQAEPGGEGGTLSADGIRQMSFSMTRRGYQPSAVDAALERLEDAFAQRERDLRVRAEGDQVWYSSARGTAQVVLDRVVRPEGHRFRRLSWFATGYAVRDVDALADRIAAFFQSGRPLTVDEIRQSAFRPQRGGYSEAQVDLVLDTVVRVVLAVR